MLRKTLIFYGARFYLTAAGFSRLKDVILTSSTILHLDDHLQLQASSFKLQVVATTPKEVILSSLSKARERLINEGNPLSLRLINKEIQI